MADISVKLNGDNSNFKRMIDDATASTNSFVRSFETLAPALSAAAIVGFFKNVIATGGALQDLAERLGVNTTTLQSFNFAVKQAGGTTEQASQVWTKAQVALDGLMSGEEGATRSFEKLHLTAKDFIGLTLEQSLEKIAKSYSENAEEAGAFSAITEILGTRSAPILNEALKKLGAEGFEELNKAAKAAGQVMDESAIKKMDEFSDRIDALKTQTTSWGATAFTWVDKAAQGLGALAAVAVNLFEGLETDQHALAKSSEAAAESIDRVIAPIRNLTEEQKKRNELLKETDKLQKIEEKNYEAIEAQNKKANDEARHGLPLVKQRAEITDELKRLEVEIGSDLEKNLDVTGKLKRVDELRGELKSIEKKQIEESVEIAKLLLKGAGNLTAAERQRLAVLQGVTKQSEINLEITQITARSVNGELTPADKERLAVLMAQSKEIAGQLADVKETAAILGKFSVSRENVTELSDTQLSALEIQARQNLSRAQAKQSASGSPFSIEKNEAADYLNQILAEVNLRRQFSATQNFQGGQYNERNYDPTTFERLSRLFDPNIAKDQSRDIADISKNLRRLIGG